MQIIKLLKLKQFFLLYFLISFLQTGIGQDTTNALLQKINIKVKGENVFQILDKIQEKTAIQFIYNPNDLNKKNSYTFSKKKVELLAVLDIIFEDGSIEYKANNEQVILYKSKSRKINQNKVVQAPKKEKIVFSGYVTDESTGEALIAAAVYEKTSFTATTTNNFGFFSLTLPAEKQIIVVSFIGYESKEFTIDKTQQVKINLTPTSNDLEEVVVTAKPKEENPIESSRMSTQRLSMEKMNAIPVFGGEADILKGITLLPGFKQGSDGTSGFYVRGGGPDQNLILLDGVPMYNPFHLWGFLSTFNSDAINNVEVTKGAFPARYGGRLSSVLDITTKDGSNQKWEKNITLGLLSARVNVGGPIKKDVSSMSFSARRTLLDLFIVPIAAERERGFVKKIGYNFGDINIKFNHKLSNKDRIYLSGFYSRDNFSLNSRQTDEGVGTQKLNSGQGWSNYFGSLRWNHLFNDKLFLNTTIYYSDYQFFNTAKKEFNSEDEAFSPSTLRESQFISIIDDLAFKQDYQYYASPNHTIRFGASAILHQFKPGVNTLFQQTGQDTQSGNSPDNTIKANEYDAYVEDDMSLGKKLKINLGVHAAGISVQDTFYQSIQPRASLNFMVNKNWSLKAGYSQMTQHLHLLTSSNLLKASDLWVPVTKNIKPLSSTQYSIGTAINIGEEYGLEIEGYYKDMKGLIDYKDGASFLVTSNDWEEKVVVGEGLSYGGEIFLQKKKGRLTGWLGYTLSWTNRTFEDINFGQTYPYKYDRRHDISIVGNYKLDDIWSFNMSWVFFSGSYVSFPTANYINAHYEGTSNYAWWQYPNEESIVGDIYLASPGVNENTSSRNNYKLPDYHRLDLTVTRKKVTKKGRDTALILGLTNAYNKFNPSFYSTSFRTSDENPTIEGLQTRILETSLFPILPTASYSITF